MTEQSINEINAMIRVLIRIGNEVRDSPNTRIADYISQAGIALMKARRELQKEIEK